MNTTAIASSAPGPEGHWLLGNLPERQKDQLGQFYRGFRDFGPICKFRFGPKNMYVVSDADSAKHVLLDHHSNYIKGFTYRGIFSLVGTGLLTSEGEFWRRQRKLSQPAFHRPELARFSEVMREEADAALKRWKNASGELDVGVEMTRVTLSIVARTLLGSDVTGEGSRSVGEALQIALVDANQRIINPLTLPLWFPTPRSLKTRAAIKTLDGEVYRMIAEHRAKKAQGAQSTDLLAKLIDAQDDETGKGMSDQQLRDEVMTLFLAGHETTSTWMTWAFYLLSQHPEAHERIQTELQTVLGDRPVQFDDLSRLEYLGRFLDETLRLYPPVWAVAREALEDDQIGGYRIEKGAGVGIAIYNLHRNPKYWDKPDQFDPDRFLPEREKQRPKYAFIPFSGGPRVCIGNHFAMIEAQMLMATWLRQVRWKLSPKHPPVEPQAVVTLRPKYGLRMTPEWLS
jgi:cytochrome P450